MEDSPSPPVAGEVVDADGHVTETHEGLVRYLGEPYRKRPIRPNAPFVPTDGWDRRLFGSIERTAKTVTDWQDALTLGGLARAVLFPTLGLHLGFLRDPAWAVALSEAYNTLLRAEFTAHDARLSGVALLPLQDVDAAVTELRRAYDELGFVGAMLSADGPYLLGHDRFDPLYEIAQTLGIPLCVHASGSDIGMPGGEPYPKLVQAHVLSHPYAQIRQLTSMVLSGTFERFPKLRVAFLEAGVGWVHFFAHRMDEEFEIRGRVEAPLLRRRPSEYIQGGNVFFSCEADEPLLADAVSFVGASQVVFASDFPHWDSRFPENVSALRGRADLTDETKRQILGGNARRLYGLR